MGYRVLDNPLSNIPIATVYDVFSYLSAGLAKYVNVQAVLASDIFFLLNHCLFQFKNVHLVYVEFEF